MKNKKKLKLFIILSINSIWSSLFGSIVEKIDLDIKNFNVNLSSKVDLKKLKNKTVFLKYNKNYNRILNIPNLTLNFNLFTNNGYKFSIDFLKNLNYFSNLQNFLLYDYNLFDANKKLKLDVDNLTKYLNNLSQIRFNFYINDICTKSNKFKLNLSIKYKVDYTDYSWSTYKNFLNNSDIYVLELNPKSEISFLLDSHYILNKNFSINLSFENNNNKNFDPIINILPEKIFNDFFNSILYNKFLNYSYDKLIHNFKYQAKLIYKKDNLKINIAIDKNIILKKIYQYTLKYLYDIKLESPLNLSLSLDYEY